MSNMESRHLLNLSVQNALDCIKENFNLKNFPGGACARNSLEKCSVRSPDERYRAHIATVYFIFRPPACQIKCMFICSRERDGCDKCICNKSYILNNYGNEIKWKMILAVVNAICVRVLIFFFFFSSFRRYFENELIKKLNAKRFLKYILKTF